MTCQFCAVGVPIDEVDGKHWVKHRTGLTSATCVDGQDSLPHGAEAEELRKGVEEVLERCAGAGLVRASELQALLDRVDAGDSLKCVETIDDLTKRLAKSEAAAGQMRADATRASAELRHAYRFGQAIDPNLVARSIELLERCVANDAGKGWVSPEEHAAQVAANTYEMREDLEVIRKWVTGLADSATCAFCAPPDTIREGKSLTMRLHMRECKAHPYSKLLALLAKAEPFLDRDPRRVQSSLIADVREALGMPPETP